MRIILHASGSFWFVCGGWWAPHLNPPPSWSCLLSLIFNLVICLCVVCFLFVVLGVYWVFWIYGCIVFTKSGKFWSLFFHFSLSRLSDSIRDIVQQLSGALFIASHLFKKISIFQIAWFLFTCLRGPFFFFFAISNLPLISSSVTFHLRFLSFSTPKVWFGSLFLKSALSIYLII